MADLTVPYNNVSNADEAFNLAKEVVTPEYVAKYNVKADVSFDEGSKTIAAKGKGFDLSIFFADSQAEVNIKLSLILRPVKKTVLDAVGRKLEKTI